MILLSTFLGQPSGSIADFYSISLVDGRIHLAFGNSAADITRFTTDGIYSDGFSHSLFVNKQANKVKKNYITFFKRYYHKNFYLMMVMTKIIIILKMKIKLIIMIIIIIFR